ncbi:hypothetical protein [Virgisporangium ochraceum]|uniref:Integral membrane protein n=1 Tax=Virgisporangium ochraceum TaxID=65505 RepID=A0A8J4E9Z5_9ACTN|nr:hypothetical protein [Virgisporangium ochraceum]GIJ66969.1 hypothetical protein Voc01_018860 [Virgisporangium ochraceum]
MTLPSRAAGGLLLAALLAMVASAAVVVPSGLTLNPTDPAATLAAVHAKPGLHVFELALDVLGWLALTAAALSLPAGRLPSGLLAAAGLAGLLHDAFNLSVTRLAADFHDPTTVTVAGAVLVVGKWMVNLAGLLWVAATAVAASTSAGRSGIASAGRSGIVAAVCGFAAVVLPWTTGTAGPSPVLEQVGYLLHLPVMVWWGVLGWRLVRQP